MKNHPLGGWMFICGYSRLFVRFRSGSLSALSMVLAERTFEL